MKFVVDAQVLRDAIGKILTVVDRKNTRPILTNCLVRAEKTKLELVATDLEVSAKLILPARVEVEGSFCINTKNIADILRELPNEPVRLSVEGGNLLNLSCKNIVYALTITGSEEFPQLTFGNNASEFRLKAKQVASLIDMTSHAISTDETRLYLNGIYLQQMEGKLRTVAIDGHRLALLDTVEFLGGSKNLDDGIIIPRKGVAELRKLAESHPDKELAISMDESFMFVQANNDYFLSVRLIAREYPKYQTVIPSKTTFGFTTDRNSVLNAVKRIRILSNEKTHGVKFAVRENELVISTNHPALGHAVEKLAIDYTGKAMEIGFNAKYLVESLGVLNDGSDVTFEFNNELSPVVIKAVDMPHFLGIIMPLKL